MMCRLAWAQARPSVSWASQDAEKASRRSSIMRLIPSPPGKIVGGQILLRIGNTERDL